MSAVGVGEGGGSIFFLFKWRWIWSIGLERLMRNSVKTSHLHSRFSSNKSINTGCIYIGVETFSFFFTLPTPLRWSVMGEFLFFSDINMYI